MQKYAAPVLRWTLTAIYFWFGINQLIDTQIWSSYVPLWMTDQGMNATTLVYINATAEILLGLLLALGIWVRPVALILSIHLAGITASLGYNAVAVRDFGLTLATFSVFLHGPDQYCLKK